MSIGLRLVHKGVLLIGTMLVLEIVFIGVLFGLLRQAEKDAWEESHAREVVTATNAVVKDLYDAGIHLFAFTQTKQPKSLEQYKLARQNMSLDFGTLTALVRDSQPRLKALQYARSLAEKSVKLLDHTGQSLSYDPDFSGVETGIDARRKLSLVQTDVVEMLNKLIEEERKSQKSLPSIQARSKERVVAWLFCGIGINLVASFVLCIWFFKGITSRIDVLVDNTRRLASGMTLNPVVGGADEIAQLDQVFHSMATALAEATKKEKAIITNAVDVICSIDKAGQFTFVTPSSVARWGFEPSELIGKELSSIVLASDLTVLTDKLNSLKSSLGLGTCEARVRRANGKIAECVWSACWSLDLDSAFIVVHDISERKELERVRQEFIAMVSHDIRTPLTAISGALTMITQGLYGEMSPKLADRIARCNSSAARLISLVNDVLDADKLDAGSFEVHPEEYPLLPIFRRAVDTVQTLADVCEVNLRMESTELDVFADEDRLEQVLVNLLSNAIKYSPQNGTVRLYAKENPDNIELSVQDEGPGIPETQHQFIFERFRQIDSELQEHKGSGLGLYICKQIVDLSNGQIGVDSVPGRGSRFWIQLPRA